MPRALPALLLATLLALGACRGPRPVHFASDPPGASVWIDGKDSGFVTPCRLELANRSSRKVELSLPGYQTSTRYLGLAKRGDLVYWRDAAVSYNTWDFPLWLGARDFFVPYKRRGGESPGRLFVRLRRASDL